MLSWFGEQGCAVLIVQGHSTGSNPSMINIEYSNTKLVFWPDTSITLSPLQLGAMYEFHAIKKTVVTYDVMGQNTADSIEFLDDFVIVLHFALCAWQSVRDLAVVSGWLASRPVPLSGIQTYSKSESLHHRGVVLPDTSSIRTYS